MVTAKGWEKYEELEKSSPDSNQCFLAMWFDKSMDEPRNNGFKPAIKDAGYDEPIPIDEKPHNEKICEEIIREIKKSQFLVADVTGNRGGVYYEAGFAHAMGKQVIFCCKQDRKEDMHFDTRQYNHILWKDAQDLREQLYNRILGTIGRGKNKKDN